MSVSLGMYVKSSDASEDPASTAARVARAIGYPFEPAPEHPNVYRCRNKFVAVLFASEIEWDKEYGDYPVSVEVFRNAHRTRMTAGLQMARNLRAAGFIVVIEDDYFGIVDIDTELEALLATAEVDEFGPVD